MKKTFYVLATVSVLLGAAPQTDRKTTADSTEQAGKSKVLAATRGDVKIIESSENIRYLSQKVAKDYLYYYRYPEDHLIREKLDNALGKLGSDFRVIATTTKDKDTKDILEFLAYSKEQIAQIFETAPNEEKAALMLDYSETLLEGADSIAAAHKYDFSKEEAMLMSAKKIEYLLQRVMKYYMAVHVGFETPTNKEQMQNAVKMLEKNLARIDAYAYPETMKQVKVTLLDSWKKNKYYLDRSDMLFIPGLMFLSGTYLESVVAQIALYHSKNQ
ncbi:Nitric oxide-responding transcriptional regulator Dnr (Crp/Fnr family) [hydrothermal vent metagenome]|uniref:Nitric oxide-responding transcriptional regulator Dnr (Crp/Fnr family) n=1 Tax=hydrothermal vent metagenome TaxID=652676 RepID=A0A1W1BP86_9ZZZZ